jgi:transposase
MGKPYSSDLRERAIGHIEAGHTRRDAAARFGVSASFAIKLDQRVKATGSVALAAQGRPPGSGALAAFRDYLVGLVEAQPDVTLRELAAALQAERGHRTHQSSISRLLKATGFSYKKSCWPAKLGAMM